MYTVSVLIEGDAPLLQHAFLLPDKQLRTESPEWMNRMHINGDGLLCQPSVHLERAMINAAGKFKIAGKRSKGKRGRTWKKAFLNYVIVEPGMAAHLRGGAPVAAPGKELNEAPTDHLSVMTVRLGCAARSQLKVGVGWQLRFVVQVIDDQLPAEVLKDVLTEAGRSEGIGDFRPKFGRFHIVEFKE